MKRERERERERERRLVLLKFFVLIVALKSRLKITGICVQ